MSYMPLITPQGTFPDVGLLHAIKLFRLGAAGGGGGGGGGGGKGSSVPYSWRVVNDHCNTL